jgi:NAD/NADP transhydrogenase beta subunit
VKKLFGRGRGIPDEGAETVIIISGYGMAVFDVEKAKTIFLIKHLTDRQG